jgi:AcrR family transcriptional regulator
MDKEPEEVSMREIATRCGVSATTIYYYYADKQTLFEAVKLDCLEKMGTFIEKRVAGASPAKAALRAGLVAFRDWAFMNPRVALLVMGRLKPNLTAGADELAPYYRSNDFAAVLLERAEIEGSIRVDDRNLASSLCIAAVWGGIECILLNRTRPEYWNDGLRFTDRMIDMCLQGIDSKGV